MKTLYGGILLGHQCFHLSNYVTSLDEKTAPVIVSQKKILRERAIKSPQQGTFSQKTAE